MKNNCLYLFIIVPMLVLLNVNAADATTGNLAITYPLQRALFPSDFRSPTFRWDDTSSATSWEISFHYPEAIPPFTVSIHEKKWRPAPSLWAVMKKHSIDADLAITITGVSEGQKTSGSVVTIRASADAVQAPIFFREVLLPVTKALKNLPKIRWRLGWVSEEEPPRVVLEKMEICANCHSFDRNGTVMGIDADFQGDKGAYVLTDIRQDTRFNDDGVISWSNVKPEPGVKTFGLFAKLSPDGRYVASTINDIAVYKMLPEISYSQLFFPVQGQVAIFDRLEKKFSVLAGADDPEYVQSNPVFSPEGNSLVFIRSKRLGREIPVVDFMERKAFYTYDLYRLPFPNADAVAPVPVLGASSNGMSNYFPRFSPDGKWLVFTQSKGFMIIQPDAQLVIIPAEGGEPRVMNCNFEGKMNSWHSFSPNGKWMVYSAKSDGPYTQLWLTHINENGEDSTPVLLEEFTAPDRAANLPEFVNIDPSLLHQIINNLSTAKP
jgi:WD40-like Beta Propeller Repeat